MNNNYYTHESQYTPSEMYDAPVLENYDPNQYADAPYQPQTPYYQPPHQQPQYQYNGNVQDLNNLQVNAQNARPTLQSAQQNLGKYKEMLGKINGMTQGNGMLDQDGNYNIGITIETLHNAINALNSVPQWIPPGKEHLVPKLTAVAAPVRDALISYMKALRTLL